MIASIALESLIDDALMCAIALVVAVRPSSFTQLRTTGEEEEANKKLVIRRVVVVAAAAVMMMPFKT